MPPRMTRDRGPQVGLTNAHGILVAALGDGTHGDRLDRLGTVEIRKPLAEVDGAMSDRQRGHLGEDRGAEIGGLANRGDIAKLYHEC